MSTDLPAADPLDDLIAVFRQLWADHNSPCECDCLGGVTVGAPPAVCRYCGQPGRPVPNPADELARLVGELRGERNKLASDVVALRAGIASALAQLRHCHHVGSLDRHDGGLVRQAIVRLEGATSGERPAGV